MINRKIHFILILPETRDLTLVEYIAMKSAKIVNPDYIVCLHCNQLINGSNYEAASKFIDLTTVSAYGNVFGTIIERVEHVVDVLKIEILLQEGGIYLDLDTLCLLPFDRYLEYECVMGKESETGLCNALIMAGKDSAFLRLWHRAYENFHNNQWNEFSVRVPLELALQNPDLIHVEPRESFFFPSFDDNSLLDLFQRKKQYPHAVIFHLWAFRAKPWITSIDFTYLSTSQSTYADAVRRIVGMDGLPDQASDRRHVMVKHDLDEAKRVFSNIYKTSSWGMGSGNGSQPYSTLGYRSFLESFITMNNVASIVDVGCGDWQSSRYVCLYNATYQGFDIVDSVVSSNASKFGTDQVSFALRPEDPLALPSADLLVIKDVLQHLSNETIWFYINHVFPRYKWCLVTNSWEAINTSKNNDIVSGKFRALDLCSPPFSIHGSYVNEIWNQWERIRTLLFSSQGTTVRC